ncbi:DUF4013 domain-containing protein [haloarchaeon 3A1-DGR]|nr:DUF4013 domain-containing protein [haloarchaeon 3A1-DGR]
MLREAIATPGRGPDVVATVLVGTALLVLARIAALAWLVGVIVDPRVVVLLPVLGAPLFLLRGYDVSVVHAGIEGDPGAPAFREFPSLYVDGVKSVLLSIGYALPAALVPVLGLAAIAVQSARESGVPLDEAVMRPFPAGLDPTAGSGPVGVGSAVIEVLQSVVVEIGDLLLDPAGVSLVTVAIGVVTVATTCSAVAGAIYVRPAGLACFAATGRLRDGLRPRRVLRVAGTGEYAVGWLLEAAVGIVGTALALALSPFLVGIAGLFVVRIVTRSLYGRGAAPALRSERSGAVEEPADSGPVAIDSGTETDPPVGHDVPPAIQVGRHVETPVTNERLRAADADGNEVEVADEDEREATDEFVWGESETADPADSGDVADGGGDVADRGSDVADRER